MVGWGRDQCWVADPLSHKPLGSWLNFLSALDIYCHFAFLFTNGLWPTSPIWRAEAGPLCFFRVSWIEALIPLGELHGYWHLSICLATSARSRSS